MTFSIVGYDPDTGDLYWRVRKIGRQIKKPVGAINSIGYRTLCINYKRYYTHRIIWLMLYGVWPEQIDHINHVRHDNRIENLREVTRGVQQKNVSMHRTNKSGVTGVSWDAKNQNWRADIGVNYRQINLGRYTDFFDAVCARKAAEHKYNFHPNHGAKL